MTAMVNALTCPMCGAGLKKDAPVCGYCGSTVIIASLAEPPSGVLDAEILARSIAEHRAQLEANPEDPHAHYALGLAYLNQQLRDAAIVHLRKAALLAPEVGQIHYNLGVALFNDGLVSRHSEEYAEGVKELEYALRLLPDMIEARAWYRFLIGSQLAATSDIGGAIAEFRFAANACPRIGIFQNNLGAQLLDAGHQSEAVAVLLRATELQSTWLPWMNLAYAYNSLKRHAEGISAARKAIECLSPSTPAGSQAMAYNALAVNLHRSGKHGEALEAIRTAARLDPANREIQGNLNFMHASGEGCFVATASVVDRDHPAVRELREFRERVLRGSSGGRNFIGWYYLHGPSIASVIAPRPWLRALCRRLLVLPAAWIAKRIR